MVATVETGLDVSDGLLRDGTSSPLFAPVALQGNCSRENIKHTELSNELVDVVQYAHWGKSVAWGLPFDIRDAIVLTDEVVHTEIAPTKAKWFVFMHSSDGRPDTLNEHGLISPMRGEGKLGEHAANYVLVYEDGLEERVEIRRRQQVGRFHPIWGESCTEAVPAKKPRSVGGFGQRAQPFHSMGQFPWPRDWAMQQMRNNVEDRGPWNNYLWAYENPHPDLSVRAIRFEPVSGALVILGLAAGRTITSPLRWGTRKKAILKLPKDTPFEATFDDQGLLQQIQLDLGQIISVIPRQIYPNHSWENTRQNLQPTTVRDEVIVEYAAHADAQFHLPGGRRVNVSSLKTELDNDDWTILPIDHASQRVTLRVVEKESRKPTPARLHVHGAAGEYLQPLNRQRVVNDGWLEDFGPDHCHGSHLCTYISGETVIDLPVGKVYVEVTKGFENKPIRKVFNIGKETKEITIELDWVLRWREKGWVTADTHVHFLSPTTAMLEGAAEGVNVINLLVSQWGEMMTNVGDFDGKSTFGTKEAGGDGEHLVRVGTENRQHVLGHISLLGYEGAMITPISSGGATESAIGDPVEVLITEWARKCHQQGGIVVLPHFPNPRLENAATLVLKEADAIEICSQDDIYSGISPYSLSDWYRYLNNGYFVAAVGGTDKMTARHAVGSVRTYAKMPHNREFTYEAWKDAVCSGRTFVTYGPLLEFEVEGRLMGEQIKLPASGGTLQVMWKVASTIMPMTEVQLIVNGEILEDRRVKPDVDKGEWSIRIDRSSWVALIVRAKYDDKPEMIAAHSSPVMVHVEGSDFFVATDALTILEQIEGTITFIETIGTRAEIKRYKEMRMVLESAHRRLHNRMHAIGYDHRHSPTMDHSEHYQ